MYPRQFFPSEAKMKKLLKRKRESLTGVVVRDEDVQFRGDGGHDLSDLIFDGIDFIRHGARGIDHDGECRPLVKVEEPPVLVAAHSLEHHVQVVVSGLRGGGERSSILSYHIPLKS